MSETILSDAPTPETEQPSEPTRRTFWSSQEVAKLSGGQRQAIAIARAVYTDANILLLDEPLAAMGAKEARLILELISNLKTMGEVSIIMIAHNYSQVLETCTQVNLLQHGTITFDKPVAETSLEELNELVMREYRIPAKRTPAKS